MERQVIGTLFQTGSLIMTKRLAGNQQKEMHAPCSVHHFNCVHKLLPHLNELYTWPNKATLCLYNSMT